MSSKYSGSQTEQVLQKLSQAEALVAVRYHYYSEQARQEGYEQIARAFANIEQNELAHAQIWLNELAAIASTSDNLQRAIQGEYGEWTDMYQQAAQQARAEGFIEVAAKMERIATVERQHEQHYQELWQDLQTNRLYVRDQETTWQCLNCGYLHVGAVAPDRCPACQHPQGFFQVQKQSTETNQA